MPNLKKEEKSSVYYVFHFFHITQKDLEQKKNKKYKREKFERKGLKILAYVFYCFYYQRNTCFNICHIQDFNRGMDVSGGDANRACRDTFLCEVY